MSHPNAWITEPDALLVGWTTFPARDAAERVARVLVAENLVACAQLDGPIHSFYNWEGKLNEDEEFRLTLKFTGDRTETLEKRLRELHPYTTPQWIVVRADRVSPDYLAWAAGTVDG
jgi:periplasmic divalent cation tolerance protein